MYERTLCSVVSAVIMFFAYSTVHLIVENLTGRAVVATAAICTLLVLLAFLIRGKK